MPPSASRLVGTDPKHVFGTVLSSLGLCTGRSRAAGRTLLPSSTGLTSTPQPPPTRTVSRGMLAGEASRWLKQYPCSREGGGTRGGESSHCINAACSRGDESARLLCPTPSNAAPKLARPAPILGVVAADARADGREERREAQAEARAEARAEAWSEARCLPPAGAGKLGCGDVGRELMPPSWPGLISPVKGVAGMEDHADSLGNASCTSAARNVCGAVMGRRGLTGVRPIAMRPTER